MIHFILLASLFSHCFFDSVSLDGAWEMAYQPYEYDRDVKELPTFKGKIIENAIPGYWEDILTSEANKDLGPFRIQALYSPQTFPILGSANDMTLPNIYGAVFYRRTVSLGHGGQAVLRFEGVRNQVHVWVNGTFTAFRQGFSTPFEVSIPDGLLHEGDNTLVLAVSNNPNLGYCDFVTGLTTRSVFGGTGGVNGHLELAFPVCDIGDVYVSTAPDCQTFTVHASGTAAFEWDIDGVLSGSSSGTQPSRDFTQPSRDFTLPVGNLNLWTPEKPVLHTLTIKAGGKSFVQKFGIRRLTAKGDRLFLNGKPVYLRGVTEHCWFPQTIHVPRDLEYYRFITAKRKSLGFNFVRFHTFVPPVEYLQACDELGMLVHIESPNFVDLKEYEAIISFARSHPSVVIYCTGNETRIDNIAEAYLESVAGLVHNGTDALFSPMSALRGMEYALFPGHDDISVDLWPHNPERFKRVRQYADIFTSYQNSASSYDAINSPLKPETVDSWAGVYGRPRLAHEICIDGTYVDFSTESKYPSGTPAAVPDMFSGLRRVLAKKGIDEKKAALYYRNSCEWQRRCRKYCFEKVRAMRSTAGYDFLGDINTHWHTFGYSVGMMDEFYNLKHSETVENVLRYNSAAVLLCNLDSDFVFKAGQTTDIQFSISDFDTDSRRAESLSGRTAYPSVAELSVKVLSLSGKCLFSKTLGCEAAPVGEVTILASVPVRLPSLRRPEQCILKAVYSGAGRVENEWEIYCFPEPKMKEETRMGQDSRVKVVSDISRDELLAAMGRGETIVLLGHGPFKYLPSTFQCGLPGRSSGNAATVIRSGHPALAGFPHNGFCGWQFRRMMESAAAVQIEGPEDIHFDPIIDVASAVKVPIRQAFMFEYKVGDGRLFVCSLVLSDNDPAAVWLKSGILAYVSSPRFVPGQEISVRQLASIIDAPLIEGSKNTNSARNIKDPSSSVRVPDCDPFIANP